MKKIAFFVAALVLALGLAQCKKEQPITPQNTEGNLVHLTVNVGASTGSATNGSRADVDTISGVVSFSNDDKLYVGYNGACVGTLNYSPTPDNPNRFSGDLNLTQSGDQPLHFYYLGGVVTQDGEQRYLVDISVQDENPYPVISYGTSTTNYSESSKAYTTRLENQCALVEFTTNRILKELDFNIEGINNQVIIDFADNTFTPTHNENSQISPYPESPTSRWAILLPSEEPVPVNVIVVGYNERVITIPPVKKNDFLHGENAVSFELTATEADKPLTMMMMFPGGGTICVINPPEGMQYEKFEWIGDNTYNSYGKNPISSDEENNIFRITVKQNDKVSFYGDGTDIKDYSQTKIVSTADVDLSGNIMSLVNEENFAAATSMAGASFAGLFSGDGFPGGTFIINASGLLLPATTLSENCYSGMFAGCSNLTDTPTELPALTLAPGCYSYMFEGCGQISEAPHLPATELVDSCYLNMFYECGSLGIVTCLATTINGTNCTTNWLYEVSDHSNEGPAKFTKAEGASCWESGPSGIPYNWSVNEY